MTENTYEKIDLASRNWSRYQAGLTRGHLEFQKRAKLNENFYVGAGKQWTDEDKEVLDSLKKPWLEENLIFPTLNTVLGYQTQSRMDIAYKPREEDDQNISDILSKLAMYITDDTKYTWKESEVFADGMIQSRGYFNITMNYDRNHFGDIDVEVEDPLDIIPDPDAKSYDPSSWSDFIKLAWMTLDDIEIAYGKKKRMEVEIRNDDVNESDFGDADEQTARNKFGNFSTNAAYISDDSGIKHCRIISRQYWKLQNRKYFFDATSGDTFPIPDDMKRQEFKRIAKQSQYEIIQKIVKRVRWTVSTRDVVLHDDWSPYDEFTIVPYFPYFRRGLTLGLVDNLVKPQEFHNKVLSQILHVVNTTANSGWTLEENSLTNMDTEDLEEVGGQTGLVLEYKKGYSEPKKIQPNQIPTGLTDIKNHTSQMIRVISGISETFQGGQGNEVSGVAIQSRVHQSAIQLAYPIDNLFRTRNLIADKILKLIQSFYTQERAFSITGVNSQGKVETQTISINKETETENGTELLNDVTVGKYDIVISDVPTQITFQNAQFSQAIEMRKFGIAIPDTEMIRMSTLSRKQDIIKQMENQPDPKQQELVQKQQELTIESIEKGNEQLKANSLAKNAEAIKKIAEVAMSIKGDPTLSPIMDVLLKTAEDMVSDKEEEMETENENEQEQQQVPTSIGNFQ